MKRYNMELFFLIKCKIIGHNQLEQLCHGKMKTMDFNQNGCPQI